MVKSTLTLLAAALVTVSVNSAVVPRPKENTGPIQPLIGQVPNFGRFALPARPAFNKRFVVSAYHKSTKKEEKVAPVAPVDDAAPADGSGTDEEYDEEYEKDEENEEEYEKDEENEEEYEKDEENEEDEDEDEEENEEDDR